MNEEQKKMFYNYQKASIEDFKRIKQKRIKKVWKWIFIFLLVSFSISNFRDSRKFFPKYLRYYDVRLNDYKLHVLEKINPTIIIPFLLDIMNGETGSFSPKKVLPPIKITQKPYIFNIKSYTCFSPYTKGIQVSCDELNKSMEKMKENDDTTYKMQILKYPFDAKYKYILSIGEVHYKYEREKNSYIARPLKTYEIIYNGDFINDLTNYIENKGVYLINLSFHYKHQTGNLYISVMNDGESIYTF